MFTKSLSFFFELTSSVGIKFRLGNPLITQNKFGNIIHNLLRFPIPQEPIQQRTFWEKARYSDLILLISIYYYHIYLLSPIMIYSPTCSGLSSLRNYCDFRFTNKWPAKFVWKFRPRILFQFSLDKTRPGNGRHNFAFGDRK